MEEAVESFSTEKRQTPTHSFANGARGLVRVSARKTRTNLRESGNLCGNLDGCEGCLVL